MVFYYVMLAAQWCTLWCAAALLLGGLPEDVRQSRFRNVPRCSVTGVIVGIFPHRRLVFALDATPARFPLLRWADFWELRDSFVRDSEQRLHASYWGTTPAWLYAMGWTILGSACLFVPAWILRAAALRFLRLAVPAK